MACTNRGTVYVRQKDPGKTRELFRKALAADPGYTRAKREIEKLDRAGGAPGAGDRSPR